MQIVNLTYLRTVTDGEPELEQELFRLFYESMDHCLAELEAASKEESSSRWAEIIHEIKGISANLGAEELNSLCSQAEDTQLTPDERYALFENIGMAYMAIRNYLISITD